MKKLAVTQNREKLVEESRMRKLASSQNKEKRVNQYLEDEKQKKEREEDIVRCLTYFISNKCIQGADQRVSSRVLLDTFNSFLLSELKKKENIQLSSRSFVKRMKALGFVKKVAAIDKQQTMQAFIAINLKNTQ